MTRPGPTEYAPFYAGYIDLVPEADIVATLAAQLDETLALLRPLPEAVGDVRHPPYTWTVKEVVGHLTDAERVFGYRALRFARGDTTPLPGFDENAYAAGRRVRPGPAGGSGGRVRGRPAVAPEPVPDPAGRRPGPAAARRTGRR